MTQIESDDHLAYHKEKRSDRRPYPDIAPRNFGVGDEFENDRKQNRNHAEEQNKVYTFQKDNRQCKRYKARVSETRARVKTAL